MTLNINSNNFKPISNIGLSSIRSGYEHLKLNASSKIESTGIKVNFSANYNSNITAYLAKGSVSGLLTGLKPNSSVHNLVPARAHALV